MPRRSRMGTGGFIFHTINRAAGGWRLFETDDDYAAFLRILEEGRQVVPIRILSYVLMPNHWHFVLWPSDDDQLSDYMQWVTATHAARWHKAHGTTGRGALYQGRFKSFPVQEDDYYYTLCRYVERNALRANLVRRAEGWRWSSLWQRLHDRADLGLHAWPIAFPTNWVEWVNQPQTEGECVRIRKSIQHNLPLGEPDWCDQTAGKLGLSARAIPRGRPRRPE